MSSIFPILKKFIPQTLIELETRFYFIFLIIFNYRAGRYFTYLSQGTLSNLKSLRWSVMLVKSR